MLINWFSILFLLLSGFNQGYSLQEGYFLQPRSPRIKWLRCLAGGLISGLTVLLLAMLVHYHSHAFTHKQQFYIATTCIFTFISFLIGLAIFLLKVGGLSRLFTLKQSYTLPPLKKISYALLAILLIFPLEFYIDPWLRGLEETEEALWLGKKSIELAVVFNAGIGISMLMGLTNVFTSERFRWVILMRKGLNSIYLISVFGILGYELATLTVMFNGADRGSLSRLMIEGTFTFMLFSGLFILIKTSSR
ncbi:MAG TPA: hypothetical protein VK609_02105 [Mucilaginibacter sp.]|nr:hypothetical protein [Mucilaginibacter sp.]